jgi:3-methyladenine DNA glycosylase AlkD
MDENVKEKLKKIKQSFRLMMNGPASQSMREKGLNYKINWGVPIPSLKQMAKEYGKDYDLAIELFKEDIRECKILATMIMPPEKFLPEIADIWMEQTISYEIAEQLAFNLMQYVDYAPVIAFEWIASDKPLYKLTGYHLLSRLFMKGQEPDERGINEFLDQADSDLSGDDTMVKHAAYNCLLRFCNLGEDYEKIAQKALGHLNIL